MPLVWERMLCMSVSCDCILSWERCVDCRAEWLLCMQLRSVIFIETCLFEGDEQCVLEHMSYPYSSRMVDVLYMWQTCTIIAGAVQDMTNWVAMVTFVSKSINVKSRSKLLRGTTGVMDLKIHLDITLSLLKTELHAELVTVCSCDLRHCRWSSKSVPIVCPCYMSTHCRWLTKLVTRYNLKQQMNFN